ncbi:ER membrane protein complex subunit 5 [Lampetra fluviatilis]
MASSSSSKSAWKAMVAFGLLALAHAAFSAAQHRSYTRLTEQENESLPSDIVLQTLLGLLVAVYGVVNIAGEFRDMDATAELKYKTFENMSNRPSFYTFNHRGRALFGQPEVPETVRAADIPNLQRRLK